MADDRQWHEIADGVKEERTRADMDEFISGAKLIVTE